MRFTVSRGWFFSRSSSLAFRVFLGQGDTFLSLGRGKSRRARAGTRQPEGVAPGEGHSCLGRARGPPGSPGFAFPSSARAASRSSRGAPVLGSSASGADLLHRHLHRQSHRSLRRLRRIVRLTICSIGCILHRAELPLVGCPSARPYWPGGTCCAGISSRGPRCAWTVCLVEGSHCRRSLLGAPLLLRSLLRPALPLDQRGASPDTAGSEASAALVAVNGMALYAPFVTSKFVGVHNLEELWIWYQHLKPPSWLALVLSVRPPAGLSSSFG